MGNSDLDDNKEDSIPLINSVGNIRPQIDTSEIYVIATSLACGSSKQKIEIASSKDVYLAEFFVELEIVENLCLDKFIMKNEDSIPTSDKPSDKIMPDVEHGKSTVGFTDRHILRQYPFDPGANFFIVTIPIPARDPCI